jgi:hypothetical protein
MTMNLQQPADSTGPPDAEQPDKPLGRGLEQISHLFLSQGASGPRLGDVSAPRLPEPVPPVQSTPQAGTTLLQPSASVSRDRLVAVLKDNPGALEEGLRIIDVFIPCHPHSDINVLALNRANQLTAIDLETGINDAIVLRGLGHLDWLKHNLVNIRRMYPQQTMAVCSQPRLFLIAPRFSTLALNAVRPLNPLQIHFIRFHAFDIGGSTGISFEPIARE